LQHIQKQKEQGLVVRLYSNNRQNSFLQNKQNTILM